MMEEPKESPPVPGEDIGALINAFRYFNEAAASLNVAYQRLEQRIEELTQQLAEKDRELYSRVRELDRLSRFLNSLLESVSSGVVAIDLDGRITIINRTASDLTGIAAEDAVGKLYGELFAVADQASALHTLVNGPELRAIEKVLPGKALRVQVSTTWVVDSLGERIGVVEIFDDVSTIRRLEERYEQQKTLSALGEMAAAVAHELRNPLSGIGGFAALLRQDVDGDEAKLRLVDKILQGVHDLDRVAGNLLFLTRRTEIKPADVDLKKLVEDLAQLLRAEAAGKGLQIDVATRLPEEGVPISGDSELLKMVFTNLGRNALQAVGQQGEVAFKLDWMLLDNRVKVDVIDTGCGIPAENFMKLFSPFFTTRTDGTGLGLALVKKAVDLHKGEITVESELNKGSRFTVSLPIRSFAVPRQADEFAIN